jgi:hypothetical protein
MTKYYYKVPHRPDSFSKKILSTVFALSIITAVFFITSCEEEPTTLGKGLLPGSDFVSIKSTDTISARAYTMYDAAVLSGNPSAAYLGQIYDPAFGITSASFATQLRLKYEWPGNRAWIVDSLKLILEFETAKGGTTGVNTLNMYEIDKRLYTDSTYYSNIEIPLASFSFTNIVLPALRTDTINNLELKLPVEDFARRILRDTSAMFHSNTVPDFRSYFKGLYFTINSTSTTDPLLVSMNLDNTGSGFFIEDRSYKNFFVMYMHDATGVTQTYYFIIDAVNGNASVAKYSHDYDAALPEKKIQHVNDFYRDSLTYLQGLNGVFTRIVLPGLSSIKNNADFDKIAVNKSRLTLPFYFDKANYKKKSLPTQLFLAYRTKSGKKYGVPDLNLGDSRSFFDGVIDTVNNVYNFNIATFVQRYFEDTTGEILPELEVVESSSTQNIIFRGNSNTKKPKFIFTYTDY